jgi:hypothetical protein
VGDVAVMPWAAGVMPEHRQALSYGCESGGLLRSLLANPDSDFQFIVPEYSGRIWFDRTSNRVLRIERVAEGIPSAFPLRSVEADVNFGEVRLGESGAYLLPVQAETRVCIRDRRECSRKTIAFRDYRKFAAESKIVPQ